MNPGKILADVTVSSPSGDTLTTDEQWREWATGSATQLLRRREGFAISHAPGKGRSSILSVFESTTYGHHVGAYSPHRERSTFRHEVGGRAARQAEEPTQ